MLVVLPEVFRDFPTFPQTNAMKLRPSGCYHSFQILFTSHTSTTLRSSS